MQKIQCAGGRVLLPKTATSRNIFSYLDNLGMFFGLSRENNESITHFRQRLMHNNTRSLNASEIGLTDAITNEFSLGHDYLISVTASKHLKLDVLADCIEVSGVNQFNRIPIISVDEDGVWQFETVSSVISNLSLVSGLTATTPNSNYNFLPAALLESQSSYVHVFNEIVPNVNTFRLGAYEDGMPLTGAVISGTLAFNDPVNFATQVSGVPQVAGEWSLDPTSNTVRVVGISNQPLRAIYTYSILESGMTMGLIANGAKVFNLMDSRMQQLMFPQSGLNYTGQEILSELYSNARTHWGK